MSIQIAIICTLDELKPYSLAAAKANPPVPKRFFSLNVSVGLSGDPGGVPVEAIFKPWMWTLDSLSAIADNGTGPGKALTTVSLLPPSATTLAPNTLAAIEASLANRFANPPQDPSSVGKENFFYWADNPSAPPGTPRPVGTNWSRLLAHASTYTAPIPHALNLSFLFSIDPAELDGMTRIFVAPNFTTGGATFTVTGAPVAVTGGFSRAYANPPAGFTMSAFQPPFPPMPTPPTTSFINFDNYWVATETGQDLPGAPPESQASEDWRTTLERRATDAFDLPQRVLVALRNLFFPAVPPTKPPVFPGPTDLANIRDSVLAAMRDAADFGLRFAPDGNNLVRFIFQRAKVDPAKYEPSLTDATNITTWTNLLVSTLGLTQLTGPNDPTQISDSVQAMRATLAMLDSVRSVVAEDDQLATLIFAQWDKQLQSVAGWLDDRLKVQAALQSLASSHALRSRLLLANLGGADPTAPIWQALIAVSTTGGYAAEVTAIQNNFTALLLAYYRGRLLNSTAPTDKLFTGRLPQANFPAGVDLTALLTTDAQNVNLAPDKQAQSSRLPHPLIVQVDNTQEAADDLTDPIRQVSGFGLLIQDQGGFWSSANVSDVYVFNDPKAADPYLECLDSVMVPLRATKRNNLRQPILVYNNASLVGQGSLVGTGRPNDPASQALNPTGTLFPDTPAPESFNHLFEFRLDPKVAPVLKNSDGSLTLPTFVQPDGKDWKRLPALKVRANTVTYRLLPFVIGAGGALPVELAVSLDDPITPVTPDVFTTRMTPAALKGFVRTMPYLRRVGVGTVRLRRALPNSDIQHELPAFPATVVPLARDLTIEASSANTGSTAGTQTRTTPVLLLWNSTTPATASFNFQLRPPACDLETWDRWVAGIPDPTAGFRNTRISVATAIRQYGPTSTATQTGFGPDLSIDDPAVTGLSFRLDKVYPVKVDGTDMEMPLNTVGPIGLNIKDDSLATLLGPVQMAGIKVMCKIGDTTQCTPDPASSTVTITVAKGAVCKLTVTPNVPELATKFEGLASANPGGPFTLWIEAAAEGVFSADPAMAPSRIQFQKTLWTNLAVTACGDPQVPPKPCNRQLQAKLLQFASDGLNPPQQNDHLMRDLIRDVDVRRQAWRWMGRNIAPLPTNWKEPATGIDDDPAGTADQLNSTLWEIGSFGERSDSDAATSQAVVNFAVQGATDKTLYTADLTADPRAQYYRFGIEVHSRYEGLDGFEVTSIRAQRSVTDPARDGNPNAFTVWRRCVTPPAPALPIPKPKILLILPLTEPATVTPGQPIPTPEMLVIANEPWFQIGGLAEELHAELMPARDPSVPLSVPDAGANPIPELGPNPILSVKSQADANLTYTNPPILVAADPVGTTFDLATVSALYGSTCFRLSPAALFWNDPKGGSLPASGLEHFQAKVRFRRVINPAPFNTDEQSLSDFTDPFWMEFQSSFVHCNIQTKPGTDPVTVPIAELKFTLGTGATNSITFSHQGPDVTLLPGPPRSDLFDLSQLTPPVKPRLRLWAVLVQEITDVTGATGFRALDILAQTDGPDGKPAAEFQSTAPAVAAGQKLQVHLVEVLEASLPNETFPGGIGNAASVLFRGAGLDTPMRIQRCSRGDVQQKV